MSLQSAPFEPGFDLVVLLEGAGESAPIAVGRRPGRVRVEAGADRAWEFDPAGRLVVAQLGPTSLHATFDGRVWGHRILGDGADRRLRPLPGGDGLHWLTGCHREMQRARAEAIRARWIRGAGGDALEFARDALALPAARSASVLRADFEQARKIWRRVPVLPPDQYEALVLQITEGCPWDRCTFCTLYRDVAYRARDLDAISRHLDEVLRYLGASAERVRRIFLGQANALLRPTGELLEIFALIRERIPVADPSLPPASRREWLRAHTPSADGFYAFVDAFHRPRPVTEWVQLREAGLRRVYVGLETGDAVLLRDLGKPLDPARAVEEVETLHAAGLDVGLILLTGIGDATVEARHHQASREIVGRMKLRRGDQVYLSPLVHPAGASLGHLESGGLLVPAEEALVALRRSLREVVDAKVPVAPYRLERLAARTPRG